MTEARKAIEGLLTEGHSNREIFEDQIIRVREVGNPKRGESAKRYALHIHNSTVGSYIRRSVNQGNPEALAASDIRWDLQHGFIEILDKEIL
jgi:hypothetical protein